jgi:hypothetical protein
LFHFGSGLFTNAHVELAWRPLTTISGNARRGRTWALGAGKVGEVTTL